MSDWRIFATIGALGLVSYALRSGGFVAAGFMREGGSLARFLRLAPGNLFIAFVAAACFEGGWPTVIGCTAALASMASTRKEWIALSAGFIAAAVAAKILDGP
jgi:uncharacterized membrane protein